MSEQANQTTEEMHMRYEHDCKRCVPLGQHEEYDLYYCESGAGMPTLVARWSSEGPDYKSGLRFIKGDDALEAAHKLAAAEGLV